MRKFFFILLLLAPVFCSAQVIRFMGRYDISAVEYVNDSTWLLTGTFVDNTGSYTGLSADTNDKIIQRGYTSDGKIVFDRYKIVGINYQTTDELSVFVQSDFTGGIQNMMGTPYSGAFPIATAVSDTSHLTYRTDFNINQIDPDYGAALDNLNLYETKAAISISTWQHEVVSDAQNNFSTSFPLLPTSIIMYNGDVLRSFQWSGIGTSTLTVSLDTKLYDFITLIK